MAEDYPVQRYARRSLELLGQHDPSRKEQADLRWAYGLPLSLGADGGQSIEVPEMFVLARALTYATLFISFVLVFLPARLLSWSGVARPPAMGLPQATGILVAAAGALLALWCVLTFALLGKGTPAPFDPPRRLVIRGPYRLVRNPMYLGAGIALAGAALYYESAALASYAGAFLLVMHAFVVWYEEPTLRAAFGAEYDGYCREVRRWRPRL
jgi:protein-S-isoprenylcysteine O-methyltransferase Ste14